MRANRSTLVKLCLLTALAVPVQKAVSAAAQSASLDASQVQNTLLAQGAIAQDVVAQDVIAQNAPELEFDAPASLEDGETLLIDGSSSMRSMNEALTAQFQERYEGATAESAESGSDTALDRLLNREIDLAAIGRPLTAEEEALGLVAVPVAREKIAVFVSPENPFEGDITFEEFGSIFRGEITEWEAVDDGSGSGALRFVDRPAESDTRQAFRGYPATFDEALEAGVTADPVATDETEAVIEALGTDGIGYAIANQVLGNPSVKIVPMHQTMPDNPAYPFSQPRNYVYLDTPTPAVAGFLAVAKSPEGAEVIEEVRDTEGAAAAQIEGPGPTAETEDGSLTARTDENNVAVIEDADGNLVAGPLAGAGGAVTALAFSPDGETLATGTNTGKVRYWGVEGEPKGEAFDVVAGTNTAVTDLAFRDNDQLFVEGRPGAPGIWGLNGLPFGETAGGAVATTGAGDGEFPWWLLWIPLLGGLGVLGWWLLGRGRGETTPEPRRQTAPTATVPPPATDPESDREVSNRAQTVISTDRVVDESRAVDTVGAVEAASPSLSSEIASGDIAGRDAGTARVGAEDISTAGINLESTDLESPSDLEGTNLDLSTPDMNLGGVALGGAAVGAAALGGAGLAGLSSDVEEDDDEEWDDNLDLTLDDAPEEAGSVIEEISAPTAIADAMPTVGTDAADVSSVEERITMPTVDTSEDVAAADESATMPSFGDAVFGDVADISMEADSTEISSAEISSAEISSAEVSSSEVDSVEIGSTEIGSTEVGSTEVGSASIGSAGAGSTEVGSAGVGSTDDSRTEDDDDFWNTSSAGAAVAGLGAAGIAAASMSGNSGTDADSQSASATEDLFDLTSDSSSDDSSGDASLGNDSSGGESPSNDSFGNDSSGNDSFGNDSSDDISTLSALEADDASADSNLSIDSIEPTRDTVIAETGAVPDIEPDENTIIGDSTVIFGGAAASSADVEAASSLSNDGATVASGSDNTAAASSALDDFADSGIVGAASAAVGIAGGAATSVAIASVGSDVKDSEMDLDSGETASDTQMRSLSPEELADVDDDLNELPEGYGESRIVLLPRDPQWAYAYWDVSNEHKQTLRDQGGQRLMLRLYDVTDINQNSQAPHGMQQFDCDEMARSWYMKIPVSDRDYTVEIGYLTSDDYWLLLARSAPMRVPPIYPSDWVKDQFVTIDFGESLAGRTFGDLGRPGDPDKMGDTPVDDLPTLYRDMFALTQSQNALRVAGSLFGSMQQMPPGALSQSGALSGYVPTASGLNMSGLNVSGLNMSGIGLGDRKRNFWLVADAELIVYGATEPDATLTIGGQVVPLSPDGTFRFHVAFPDGDMSYPIKAVAADGEQSRSITMNFERETPERNTNTKEDAQDEWF